MAMSIIVYQMSTVEAKKRMRMRVMVRWEAASTSATHVPNGHR